MGLVTIPFDFDESRDLPLVVPICIEDTDRHGHLINPGWLRAVVPIAEPLRRLAHRVIGDLQRGRFTLSGTSTVTISDAIRAGASTHTRSGERRT